MNLNLELTEEEKKRIDEYLTEEKDMDEVKKENKESGELFQSSMKSRKFILVVGFLLFVMVSITVFLSLNILTQDLFVDLIKYCGYIVVAYAITNVTQKLGGVGNLFTSKKDR